MIRGLGAMIKKKKNRSLISEEGLDFIAVQETKMEQIDSQVCEQIWGDADCGRVYSPAFGNAGGMLKIWNIRRGN